MQRAIPDGNCLYRALSIALIFLKTGFNPGSGCGVHKEKNIGDAFHNATMIWLRHLIAHRMNGDDVDIYTKWNGLSLRRVLHIAKKYFEKYGTQRQFTNKR